MLPLADGAEVGASGKSDIAKDGDEDVCVLVLCLVERRKGDGRGRDVV